MEDHELKRYQDRLELGEKAKELFGGAVGKLLTQSMEKDVAEAIDDFLDTDPTDAKRITAIQVRIKVAIAVPEWLEKAIADGQTAFEEYRDRKEAEEAVKKQR